MKSILKLGAMLLPAAMLASCMGQIMNITGKGQVLTKDISINSASEILNVSRTIDVILDDNLKAGEANITTHENIFQYLDIHDTNYELQLGYNINNIGDVDVVFHLSKEQFKDFIISGAADVKIGKGKPLSANDLSINISGAGDFEGEVDIDGLLRCIASGASDLSIKGNCTEIEIKVSGASDFDANELITQEAQVDASGASNIEIHATKELNATVSGASSLYYYGDPRTSISVSGASSAQKKGI